MAIAPRPSDGGQTGGWFARRTLCWFRPAGPRGLSCHHGQGRDWALSRALRLECPMPRRSGRRQPGVLCVKLSRQVSVFPHPDKSESAPSVPSVGTAEGY